MCLVLVFPPTIRVFSLFCCCFLYTYKINKKNLIKNMVLRLWQWIISLLCFLLLAANIKMVFISGNVCGLRLLVWSANPWRERFLFLSSPFTKRSEVRLSCRTATWGSEGFRDLPQDTAVGRRLNPDHPVLRIVFLITELKLTAWV